MAIVAQLVRALVCGTRGRRFESGLSPHFYFCKTRLPKNFENLYISMILLPFRVDLNFLK